MLKEAQERAAEEATRLEAAENIAGSQLSDALKQRRQAEQERRRNDLVRRARADALKRFTSGTSTGRGPCDTRVKYLSFAASLAAAQSAEEVATALRTASAPVGSYRSKRNQEDTGPVLKRWGPGSVSAVGYLGGTFGWERVGGRAPSTNDANHAGLALPIGIEISLGSPLGALSVFAPVLDVGMLASARLRGDENDGTAVSASPQIGFEQVFAPGAYLMLNTTRSWPLSMGFGLQSVGALREREVRDASGVVVRTEKVDVVRASFIVGVDATLFHFRF
jgi:hypothetical protein